MNLSSVSAFMMARRQAAEQMTRQSPDTQVEEASGLSTTEAMLVGK